MTFPTRKSAQQPSRAEGDPRRTDHETAEITSETLLGNRREIFIRHGAEQYRLRLTRMNKLILTK
jgi:hemin uptake protein HemP